MLLDQVHKLKAQSQSPVHIQALRKLILAAVTEEEQEDVILEKEETDEVAGSSDWSALESTSPEELLLQNLNQLSTNSPASANAIKSTDVSVNSYSDSKTNMKDADAEAARARRVYLITRVEALLTRITNTVDSDSAVWDAVAVFYSLLNKPNDVKEARVKEVCI